MIGCQSLKSKRSDDHWGMTDILNVICPMHLVLNKTGHIVHVGPTLEKFVRNRNGSENGFLKCLS